jgi:6-phosphogluconolactonase
MSTVKTYRDPAALADAAARQVIAITKAAIAERGQATLALSGGSTPRLLYARLAQDDLATQLDWAAIHVFWGDERPVPPEHEDSNYRMAWEAWLSHVPIPAQNVHRMHGEMAPVAAAAEYEGMLRTYFAARIRRGDALTAAFDLVLLGMGEDGHTASLFPGAEAIRETKRWVTAYQVDRLASWRISLTPAALNAARHILFLVSGASKAGRLQQVLYGTYQPDRLPAQIIRPMRGSLLWMVDEAAAGRDGPA